MRPEPDLYYFYAPRGDQAVDLPVEFVPAHELLADEPACQAVWELIGAHFRTRCKFLTVWPSVRYVALCRQPDGAVAGFLLVSAPINWQIDYVVVRPECRGRGIATALINATLNEALARRVPYVMLTSRESLRSLYERCGFSVVGAPQLVA
jgi:ribosomal protein S18 acetylase RimI-like enzyme